MTTEEKEKIKSMRLQGKSYSKIGEFLGISSNTISAYCRRHGLGSNLPKDAVLCKCCGKPIISIPKHKKRKFCSDNCRTTWWNSHLEEVNRKAVYHFICVHCGNPFTAYGNKNRKYCSHSCYISDRFGKEDNCNE